MMVRELFLPLRWHSGFAPAQKELAGCEMVPLQAVVVPMSETPVFASFASVTT